MIDITERKQDEEALGKSEEHQRIIVHTALDAIITIDASGSVVEFNPAAEKIFGFRSEEIRGQKLVETIIPPSLRRKHRAGFRRYLKTGEHNILEQRIEITGLRADGEEFPVELTVTPYTVGGEQFFTSFLRDITERKKAEEALQNSEERFRAVIEYTPGAIVIKDLDGRNRIVNKTFCDWYAMDNKEILGKSVRDFLAKEDADLIIAQERKIVETGEVVEQERRVTYPDGVSRAVLVQKFPIPGPKGEIVAVGTVINDITERKRAEEELSEQKNRLQTALDNMNGGIFMFDKDLRIQVASPSFQAFYELPVDMVVSGVSAIDLMKLRIERGDYGPGDRDELLAKRIEIYRNPEPTTVEDKTPNGRLMELRVSPMPNGGLVGVFNDITERKDAENQLRKLSLAVEQSPASVMITDTDGTIEYVNPKFTEITGYSPEEAIGQTTLMLKSGKTPNAVYERLWATIMAGEEWRGTLRNKRKDGTVYLAGITISPIMAPDGTVTHFVWAQQDITQRFEDERRLKQADKMESLGGLAGGIAHDFNNMLLPILSLTDMTRKSLPEDSRERLRLDKVFEAATRAKDLVARILAFSHQEDTVRQNIDIYAAIDETMGLLRSTLPTTIKIKQRLKRNTGTVFADRAQIASVLLNLASNAADAMDGKTGQLKVSLSPVKVSKKMASSILGLHQGKFAKLAVKDEGHGMDEEILARVMDPFFTTKPVGEGTGLGLFLVHGIVFKHDGTVNIFTTPGKGTTVEVYLPLVEGEADHESRDGGDVTGDVGAPTGRSAELSTTMKKQARKDKLDQTTKENR